MKYKKKHLLSIAKKIELKHALTYEEVLHLQTFEKVSKQPFFLKLLQQLAVPLSLLAGFFFVVFPEYFEGIATTLPPWTNLPPHVLQGVDYLWDIIGEPVRNANIMYHLPNIVLYSFGIFGIKKMFDALTQRSWLDRVIFAQKQLQENIRTGLQNFHLKHGHSLLFVGKGDFIGHQFCVDQNPDLAITIAPVKPSYTDVWSYYDIDTMYDDLKDVLLRASGENAGEYIFFPVKDDQIFLPNEKAYDLSPHKLDILLQDIRTIEKELKWKPKRVIIIGDKYHTSFVQSEDQKGKIKHSEDAITLETITKKYKQVTLLDPTDIVLKEIIALAHGRKIVFRATKDGIREYKERFYTRLHALGYKELKSHKGILTIGYDLFEDQTEQQTLSRKIDDYYPVVLSKNVRDALIRNGYKKKEFLYVPDIVLHILEKTAAEQ